jgi:hypothetical protein
MPFRLDYFKKGHEGMEYPHYMLYNIHKDKYANKVFKNRDGAINFAKNSIMFREKKKSKVTKKGNKTFILPV